MMPEVVGVKNPSLPTCKSFEWGILIRYIELNMPNLDIEINISSYIPRPLFADLKLFANVIGAASGFPFNTRGCQRNTKVDPRGW
jgi:hypothetical protein